MNFKCLLAFLCLILSVLSIHGQTYADTLSSRIDQLHKSSTITGLAVAIINSDGILYKHAKGWADIENKVPYSTAHIQNIGSISKTYIAAALMKAVEAGKIDLDDPINKFLSFSVNNPHSPNVPITVRHLETHTSGIKDYLNYAKAYYLVEDISDWTKGQKKIKKIKVKKFAKHPKMSLSEYLKAYLIKGGSYYGKANFSKVKPGKKYKYSNIAAGLLGQVIGEAVGENFNTYSRRLVLEELGLHNSGWMHADVDMSNHAVLYGPENKRIPKYALTTYPDGGMITSTAELAAYAVAMMNGFNGDSDYLAPATFKEMMTSQWKRPEFRNVDFADEHVGIIWDLAKDGSYIGHNGSDPGTFSFLRFFPDKNIGYVFLMNCGIDEEKSRVSTIQKMFDNISIYGKKMNGM